MNARSISQGWQQYSSMINGALLVLGFAATLMSFGSYKTDLEQSIATNNKEIEAIKAKQDGLWSQHTDLHKERLAEVKANEASTNERFRISEQRANEVDRKIDNLTYRVTVAEQSTANITSSIRELQGLVNKTAGDLQVVREILQRMEARVKKTSADPSPMYGCADNEVWVSHAGIYHTPDSPWRTRLHPVKCYETAEAAEKDGFRPPKSLKVPGRSLAVAQ